MFVLGALNFSIFWSMLFVSAYRLPGGVAATLGAVQPLIVIFLAHALLGSVIRVVAVLSALAGIAGVALLVLTPSAALDFVGVAAGIAGAVSMALGTVLTRRWKPPASLLTATAWQLTAGGILLLPVAFAFEPSLPSLTLENLAGFVYLAIPGAALTYLLWFRGVSRLEPSIVASLTLLSPVAAVLLGWGFLGQTFTTLQLIGISIVAASVYFSQHAHPKFTASPQQSDGEGSRPRRAAGVLPS